MSGRGQNSNRAVSHQTKGQRKDSMARKREERAARTAYKKQRQAQAYLADDETFAKFAAQLAKNGLELRDIPGDGNCLFRALGDQLEGHSRNHLKHRRDVVKFMLDHRGDFEPFVEDDVPFEKHVKNLNEIGTYAGNDAIVAFARLHQVNVFIYQVNTPCWQIHGTDKNELKQLHISYHNGDHYSSIRKLGDHSESPANIKLYDEDTQKAPSTKPPKNNQKPQHSNGYAQEWATSDEYFYGGDPYDGEYTEDYQVDGQGTEMASAVRTEDDTLETIMRLTGCEDMELVRQTLSDVGNDVDTATDLVFQFMSTTTEPIQNGISQSSSGNGLWSDDGSGTRIFGGVVNGDSHRSRGGFDQDSLGAKPKLRQQSTSLRNRKKKEEKKARAAERRRNDRLGTTAPSGGGSSDEDYHIVTDNMGTLKI